jgi:O-antigen ligase
VQAAAISPRAAVGWPEYGLEAATLLFLPVLAFASHGLAPLESIAGLFAFVLARRHGAPLRPLAVPAVLFGLVVLWGAVSAAWAPNPLRSLLIAGRLAGLFAAGLALVAVVPVIADPARLVRCFLVGVVLGLAILAVESATSGLLTRPFFVRGFVMPELNQASDALAMLALPAAAWLALWRRPVLAVLLLLAAAAAIYGLVGTAAQASFAVALATAALCWRWRRPVARAAAVLAVLAVAAAPLTLPRLAAVAPLMRGAAEVKSSASHRLLIWSFVGARIAEKPLLGWGLDSSRAIPGGQVLIRPGQPWLPLHPHDAPLQLWLELGVPGAVLGALVAGWLWTGLAAAEWPHLFAAAAAGGLAAAMTELLATYGLWEEWWLGTLWLAAFLVLVMARAAAPAKAERSPSVSM